MTKYIAILLLLLGCAVAKSKATYTFDPYSLIRSTYKPEDCTREGDTLSCKVATLEFSAMIYGTPAEIQERTSAKHGAVIAEQPKAGAVAITFNPKQCKFAPPKAKIKNSLVKWEQHDEWKCKDVTFRWLK